MRFFILLNALAILAVAPVNAAEDTAIKDAAKLQGNWNVVALEAGGKKAPRDSFKNKRFLIKGNKISFSGKPKELRPYRLNATTKPKSIDLGDEKKFSKAIYELKGNTLKLCFSQSTKQDRPNGFDTAGTVYLCYTLKGVKP